MLRKILLTKEKILDEVRIGSNRTLSPYPNASCEQKKFSFSLIHVPSLDKRSNFKLHTSYFSLQLTSLFTLVLLLQMNFGEAIASPIKFVPPPPPPDRGAAGDRGGGASRGCIGNQESLMALVPLYNQTLNQNQESAIPITKVWGLTTQEHPSFWFFLPHNISSIHKVEFILKDESNKPSKNIYQTLVTPPPTPGIVSIHLPSSSAGLQVGNMYHWFFKVYVKCNPEQAVQLESVEGWAQRISPNTSLIEGLKQATPQQQVGLYAQNGIWYDALTTLGELRLAQPKDGTLTADWTNLLNSASLENLATQPLVNCCSFN